MKKVILIDRQEFFEMIINAETFPYIPFYITRYEKEIVSENDIEIAVKDLGYFRNMLHIRGRKYQLS